MRARVETLRTIASVEEERFTLLDLGELVPQTFDLPTLLQPGPNNALRMRTCLGRCYQRWKGRNFGQHPSSP
jgi:hypothetical protein